MTTTISTNGELVPDLQERCRSLEQECAELRERLARLENPPPKPRRRIRTIIADGLFVVLAGVVVAATVGAVAIATGVWKLDSGDSSEPQASAPAVASTTAAQAAQTTAPAEDGPFAGGAVSQGTTVGGAGTVASETPAAAGAPVQLKALAVGGACWLQVRRGGADGKILWEGILPEGDSVELDGKRFWLRVGDPTNLRLVVNGERVTDLPSLAADLIVTESGARVVPTSP